MFVEKLPHLQAEVAHLRQTKGFYRGVGGIHVLVEEEPIVMAEAGDALNGWPWYEDAPQLPIEASPGFEVSNEVIVRGFHGGIIGE